jgi:hypothetical protein
MYKVPDIKMKTLKTSKREIIYFFMQKSETRTPPCTTGLSLTCHIVQQIQTYLCENKIAL